MFLLLLLFISSGKTTTVYCDRVIYEHYYNIEDPTKFVYDELIFYEQDPLTKVFLVQNCFLLLENYFDKTKSILYIYRKQGEYDTFIIYRDQKTIIVKTKIFLEVTTVAKRDLERQNKDILPEEKRRSLW